MDEVEEQSKQASAATGPVDREHFHDGMCLVGLEIVGLDLVDHHLMKINVSGFGGLSSSEKQTGMDFKAEITGDLEHPVKYNQHYGLAMLNTELTTLRNSRRDHQRLLPSRNATDLR